MNKKILRLFFLLVFAVTMEACTARQWYEGAKSGRRLECNNLPPSEYDSCVGQANKDYEEYKKEREEVIKD